MWVILFFRARGAISISAFGSAFSSFSVPVTPPGKNPSTMTGSRYPAVRSAEISSTTGPSTSKIPVPLSIAAVAMAHLLVNPPMGGIPTREMEAAVKHRRVSGISRPIPISSVTLRIFNL